MATPPPPPQPHTQVTRRGANHTLHIVLTICTCGLWAVTGWPIAAILGRKTSTTVYGQQQGPYPPQQPYGQQQPGYGPPPASYPTPPPGHQPPKQWPPRQ